MIHLTTSDISLALLLLDQLRAFDQAGFEVLGVSQPGPFVAQIESAGIMHIPLHNATRSISIGSDIRVMREFRQVLEELKPDLVHTHNPKPGLFGRIISDLQGVPVVVNTVHGLYATQDDSLKRRALVYGLERFAASFSDIELVQNEEDIAVLEKLRVPSKKVRLLGNGIDLDRFSRSRVSQESVLELRSSLGAGEKSLIVLAVGRLVWEKGYAELFECAKQVATTHPQAIFAVVGPPDPSKADGIGEERLEEAKRSGVRILGLREDIEVVYAASDIYVLPSHREGFPRSAMEASAMGLPVVATDIRGCRQVVAHGETGLLVPPRDVPTLLSAITSLLEDPVLRRRLGAMGAVKARRDFDQQDVIDKTLEVYEELLTRSRNRP